jgi:hypothetical protein
MESAGVDGVPTITFLEEAEGLDYTVRMAV